MKKILLSLFTVALVAGGLWAGTSAYFTDTETSTGNTFTTGTIDISVNDLNPWNQSFAMNDMKPSQVEYIDMVVYNNGTNPVNLYKTLTGFDTYELDNPGTSEPECFAEGGSYSGGVCSGNNPVNNIDDWINYDMIVEVYDRDPRSGNPTPVWWETLYLDSDDVKVGSLKNQSMYLGMVPAGWYMKVMQSYHMVSVAENQYQSDGMSFTINLEAEQLGAHALRLENKAEVNGISRTLYDGTYADLSYGVKDREFSYSLDVNGVAAGDYTLLAWENTSTYPDAWKWGEFGGTVVLDHVTVSTDPETISGSVELNRNVTNAKVWLVPGTVGNPGDVGVSIPWSPSGTLFETGLMTYYDADL